MPRFLIYTETMGTDGRTLPKGKRTLKLILFLFDIRRMPNDDDRQFLEWVAQNNKAMILFLQR